MLYALPRGEPTLSMKSNRIFAYLIGCAALASTVFVYMDYVRMLGFPDGFISELGRAERKLAYVFIGIGIVSGTYFIYLGWMAARKRIGKKLLAAVFVYLVSIIILSLIDYYYRLHLMGSTGG
jgi:hypothetical protein